MPLAFTVAFCGTPSNTSSKPNDAGPAICSAAPAVPCSSTGTRVTSPSSRNCSSDGAAARLVDRASRLVPHLTSGAGDAEQLVDRRDLEQRQPREPIGELHRRQRLEPALLALLGAEALAGQRPRRRLEDVPVLRVAMLQRVLEVVGRDWPTSRAARQSSIAAAATTWSSSCTSCARLSSASRTRVLSSRLPRRTFSSMGRSSTTGITCLRTWLSSRLSRYSAALALTRASPCSSDQRAAEMSFHG